MTTPAPATQPKHFNQGNIWGKIRSADYRYSANGKPFIALSIDCNTDKYGSVLAFARLWGKEKSDTFMVAYEKNPDAIFRFRGLISQYTTEEGIIQTNFTLHNFELPELPVSGGIRATFILKGELMVKEKKANEGILYIKFARAATENYEAKEEEFQIFTLTPGMVDGVQENQLVEVKGRLRTREDGEEYGCASGEIKPYAELVTAK